jgi:hypothetical protein
MQLAKSVIDIGLSTNNLEPMLRFWQQDAAVRFDHVLPVRRGQKQYRHDQQGSIIKLNHHAEALPEAAPLVSNVRGIKGEPYTDIPDGA